MRISNSFYNKYNAKKVYTDEGKFDSQKEFDRYRELSLQQSSGQIKNLQRQVKFVLFPSQRDDKGKLLERECSYYADFVYEENGNTIVEDTKGVRPKDYIIKRKAMLYFYGIIIREI